MSEGKKIAVVTGASAGIGAATAGALGRAGFSLVLGARRLFLTEETDPEKIERDLIAVLPREEWTRFALLLQDHGRKICKARKPECAICPVADLCPSAEV